MDGKKVVIVEDEEKIARLLADYLAREGFVVRMLHEGSAAVEFIREQQPDFVILDLMLPGKDGMSICREVRRFSTVPVMMLTARVDEIDRLLGLEIGADDYVCKPFLPREVIARIHAILRRIERPRPPQQATEEERLEYRDIVLYPARYRCVVAGELLDLTPVEFRLLHTLMAHIGLVYSREQLMQHCYTDDRVISDRTIDSHLKNLRRKLQLVMPDNVIHSVYGVGYRME